VCAIAIEDKKSWGAPTWVNLYVLRRGEQTLLIDAGMNQYKAEIQKAFIQIGIEPGSVTHILITHGHRDHVEGVGLFPQAKKFCHAADLPMIARTLRSQFLPYAVVTSGEDLAVQTIQDLDIIHVNTHSPGSVVLYDPISKTMFAGDFFCFWGEPLPGGELVSYSTQTREESCQYVAEQAADGGLEFDNFMAGLKKLLPYHPEFFCTGHGVILQGDIHGFLRDLYDSGKRK
jgi:glyoxylase-like metal-dependent hydrolase (beta-lactamase superfamily II)